MPLIGFCEIFKMLTYSIFNLFISHEKMVKNRYIHDSDATHHNESTFSLDKELKQVGAEYV